MKKWWKLIFFIGALGIILTFMGGKDVIRMSKDPIDMNTVDWGTLEAGDHVHFTVDMVWGQFYQENSEQKTFGITTSSRESGRGYAIPHLYVDERGFYNIDYYIGLHLANPSDYNVIEQVLAESDAWYYDTTGTVDYGMTTLYIDGTVEKMSSQQKEFMRDYLRSCEYTDSEIDRMMCPFMIERGNMQASKITLGIGIVCDVILLIMLGILFYQDKKEKEEFAGHTYMGVNQTGSMDLYGGTNYGGNHYGASNQYDKPYEGPVYGDTSYGGTNTYGQNSTYGATNSYGQSSGYGATDTYGQNSGYGATDAYGQNSTYGATNTYGQSNSYGATDTYGRNDTYGTSDSYAGNSTYGTQENATGEWPWQPKQ